MTTILAGGRPLTLLPEKAAFIEASRTLLDGRRAHRQGGELSRPRRAGAPRHDERNPGRPRRAGGEDGGAAHRLSRRLPPFRTRPRCGDARRGQRLARAAHRPRARAGPRQPRRSRRRPAGARSRIEVVDEPLHARTNLALCHHPRPRVWCISCWPAISIRASASVGERSFGRPAPAVLPLQRRRGCACLHSAAFTGMHPITRCAWTDRVFPIADRTVALIRRADLRRRLTPVASEPLTLGEWARGEALLNFTPSCRPCLLLSKNSSRAPRRYWARHRGRVAASSAASARLERRPPRFVIGKRGGSGSIEAGAGTWPTIKLSDAAVEVEPQKGAPAAQHGAVRRGPSQPTTCC